MGATDFEKTFELMLKSYPENMEDLVEFSPVPTNKIDEEQAPDEEDESKEIFSVTIKDRQSLEGRVVPIDGSYTKRPIAAVDSSSVTLGRTNSGIIAAIKAAVVLPDSVETFGPFIHHITQTNKNRIYNYFMKDIFGLSATQTTPNLSKMPDRLRNFLERFVQRYAASKIDDGIILWDGSLGAGKSQFDTPEELMLSSLAFARKNGNSVIAVTKKTTLILSSNEDIFSVLGGLDGPVMVDLTDKIAVFGSRTYKILGNTFAAKLSYNGLPFRIDVSPSVGISSSMALVDLIGSTSFYHGYPVQLRNAHIYSKITKDEALACQKMIATKYNIPIVSTPDIHKILLSPFG
jgi:hypothetical protein